MFFNVFLFCLKGYSETLSCVVSMTEIYDTFSWVQKIYILEQTSDDFLVICKRI